mgnify:FL=1
MRMKERAITVSKKNSATPIIVLILLIILGGAGYYIYNQGGFGGSVETDTADITAEVQMETAADSETDATDISETVAEDDMATSNQAEQDVSDNAAQGDEPGFDLDNALAPRAIGNPDAPVVVKEFASMTCGHCGDFHRNVFDQIKEEYIDTGKVYFIMNDFPLNGPAVHASMVARCLPNARYHSFIEMLFDNQDKWAYDAGYINYLRQNAALAGLGNEAFDACIGNDDLRDGLINQMKQAQNNYAINSTPTFVFNETTVHTGARNYEFYKGVIEAELAKAGGTAVDDGSEPAQKPEADESAESGE